MKHMLLIPILLLSAVPVWADDDRHEHDRARRAVEAGQILPLRTILDRTADPRHGQLLEAELESEHGKLVYELKFLTPDGRVVELLVDAATGEMLGEEKKRKER